MAGVVDGSGSAVAGAVGAGVEVLALALGVLVVGATVTVAVLVGGLACDPHPVNASTAAATSAAPPRNRMTAR